MKNKWKKICLCFVLIASVLLDPVVRVFAADGIYDEEIPYLKGINFSMMENLNSDRTFLEDIFMKNKYIENFSFQFDKQDGVVYENYNVVFDFVLKSQLEDNSISTYEYSTSIDLSNIGKLGLWDRFLINCGFKDDFIFLNFNFGDLVSKAPDCTFEERYAANGLTMTPQKKKVYNTVISQIDCYLVDKNTGNYGAITRFTLSWDEIFWHALCTNITFELIMPETGEVIENNSVSDLTGSYGIDSDGDNSGVKLKSIISNIAEFLTEIPLVIYAIISGFFGVFGRIGDLFHAIFPFLPALIFDVFSVIIFITVGIAIWCMVKGD